MSSFEIASQVTWNSLPILPSIFGLSSQNIVIPHYSCHSVQQGLEWWGCYLRAAMIFRSDYIVPDASTTFKNWALVLVQKITSHLHNNFDLIVYSKRYERLLTDSASLSRPMPFWLPLSTLLIDLIQGLHMEMKRNLKLFYSFWTLA